MNTIQEFAIRNIHCSPSEDRQFRFTLIRATKPKEPVVMRGSVFKHIYHALPDDKHKYHLYSIGGFPPEMLNLMEGNPCCMCRRTGWINVEEDMNERTYILQIYNDDGVNCPRANIFYRVDKENNLIFAIRVDDAMRVSFDVDSFKYIRVYTNRYYRYNNPEAKIFIRGIEVKSQSNVVDLQREAIERKKLGGEFLYFVNGHYTQELRLNIPTGSYIEYIHDRTIDSVSEFTLRDLKTFMSLKTGRQEYLLHRERDTDFILYEDDLEIYILGGEQSTYPKGAYYYQNRDYALNNVTDKDFAVDAHFVNNQNRYVSGINIQPPETSKIVVFTRRPPIDRGLIYNAMKLHELYKLPKRIELSLIAGNANYSPDFKAPILENSPYFKIAAMTNFLDITKELATDALGYGATSYYFGLTPERTYEHKYVDVPHLYRINSLAYEYDRNGILLGYYTSNGPKYILHDPKCQFVEFIQGEPPRYHSLYKSGEVFHFDRRHEAKIFTAVFDNSKRISDWIDNTESPDLIHHKGEIYTIRTENDERTHVVSLVTPVIMDLDLYTEKSFRPFPLTIKVANGAVISDVPIDYYCDTVEIFMNGYRLLEGIDFQMDYPMIQICNKEFVDQTTDIQKIHIRATGYTDRKARINEREIAGFINNGALTRNNVYDLRDDKVFSLWIDGRLWDRDEVYFAEEDNSVRVNHVLNGMPYVMADHIVSLYPVTETPTIDYFNENREKDIRISELFSEIYPEPEIDDFNIINGHHMLFSPLISKVMRDLEQGNILPIVYARRYNDQVIRDLMDQKYATEWRLDPVRFLDLGSLIEIHPDYSTDVHYLTQHQYRFLKDVVNLLTNGHPDKVNLSGHVKITTDLDEVDDETVLNPDF